MWANSFIASPNCLGSIWPSAARRAAANSSRPAGRFRLLDGRLGRVGGRLAERLLQMVDRLHRLGGVLAQCLLTDAVEVLFEHLGLLGRQDLLLLEHLDLVGELLHLAADLQGVSPPEGK